MSVSAISFLYFLTSLYRRDTEKNVGNKQNRSYWTIELLLKVFLVIGFPW